MVHTSVRMADVAQCEVSARRLLPTVLPRTRDLPNALSVKFWLSSTSRFDASYVSASSTRTRLSSSNVISTPSIAPRLIVRANQTWST
jgi:hypothetical protein